MREGIPVVQMLVIAIVVAGLVFRELSNLPEIEKSEIVDTCMGIFGCTGPGPAEVAAMVGLLVVAGAIVAVQIMMRKHYE